MVCLSDRCLRALVVTASLAWIPALVGAQGLLEADFGESGKSSTAFLVGSGSEVVTLGVSGRNLGAARLHGVSPAPSAKVVDPVSRLVVFRMPNRQGGAFRLATRASANELLRAPGGTPAAKVEARVEKIAGKYLPFTLLRLRYDESAPAPGTPLLDGSGAVVAIAHEAVGGNGGYAIPVEVLHRALESARQGRGVRRAWLGLSLNPASGSALVTRTVANSPASRAGLRKGDVLTEIDGVRISDYGDAVNAFFLLRPGKAARVKVKRGKELVELDLVPAGSKS